MTLAVVTATLDMNRALACVNSWWNRSSGAVDLGYIVVQANTTHPRRWEWPIDGIPLMVYSTEDILGTVPSFAIGVQKALEDGADLIACFHDDLLIEEDGWDETVIRLFKACPRAGLCGFGGAKGLGADDIYKTPYNPMQLARIGFRSNMRDAEAHGLRSTSAEPVACLDGFSQIGTARFWRGQLRFQTSGERIPWITDNLFAEMQRQGVTHHFYDGMLGCYAKRLGYQTWFLPVACHHFGGRTAVGDARYIAWANAQNGDLDGLNGDAKFWIQAHQIGYEEFHDVLPLRS